MSDNERFEKEKLSLQVLVSTMSRNNYEFLKKMNIKSDIVLGNQNGSDEEFIFEDSNRKIECFCSSKIGLSNNRNLTLEKATADICLIADDDIEYIDGYENIVIDSFRKKNDADIIIFNLYEEPIMRHIIKKEYRVNYFNYMRFGSVRIAFRRRSIVDKHIYFDPQYGAGGEIPMGEDTIFLHDCLKAGLKIYAVPNYLLLLKNERESTWFKGYDELYFNNKGKLYYRISEKFSGFFCLQDAFRHRKKYKEYGSWIKVYKDMEKGRRYLKGLVK